MPNEILIETAPTPSAIIWADTTDFAPGASARNNYGARTHQIDLTSLAVGAYRQGAKADLGANPAPRYNIFACFELDIAPSAGDLIEMYFGFSNSATAGQATTANLSGADAAYTGLSTDADDAIKRLGGPQGIMPLSALAAPNFQVGQCGVLIPQGRYVMPVVKNASDQAFEGDAVEMFVALFPYVPEIQ